MKSEIKTALILCMIIAAGVGILGLIFASLDETKSTSTLTEIDSLLKIDKSGFKAAPRFSRDCTLPKYNTQRIN